MVAATRSSRPYGNSFSLGLVAAELDRGISNFRPSATVLISCLDPCNRTSFFTTYSNTDCYSKVESPSCEHGAKVRIILRLHSAQFQGDSWMPRMIPNSTGSQSAGRTLMWAPTIVYDCMQNPVPHERPGGFVWVVQPVAMPQVDLVM